ncbi:FK506-binding protein 15-like isoform X2 [Mya arenaria]|uniref:FK506-binding protein 15-like isoform X2 n=1 Tax=Mya arenaria TaxID=6604 RepID=UPI0022E66481|nr:FK506-binding protein 15-like isoform X2 [Mya arenaria]
MFFDKEDEEQDFLSPGASKLGALFGMDKAGNKGGNESLTYTAPKQPKKKESTPPAGKGAAPAVAFAIAVHAYKYIDGKYASQGKLGCAILASHAASEYSILMYVTQQQKVTSAKITATFSYTTQENNYANFYDDARQSWSILFDNEKNATDFAKHVCLAKALSTGPVPTSMVTQDLVAGEGGALETGDSVEVRYTGWLLANNTFGQVFDSNASADKLFRFKLGAGKVIKGWDTGVVGIKKGGKRFLVVPPDMAYGSQGMGGRVPPNSTLLFEVEVVRVKLIGRESTPSPHPTHPAPGGSGDGEEIEEDDVTVKQRTRSINEQLSHSPTQDMSKAKLISRMAKMGKPMLPLSGAVPAGPESDHDDHVPESPTPISGQAANQGAPSPAPVHQRVTPVAQPAPIVQPQPAFVPVQQPVAPAQTFTGFTNQQQPAFLQNLPVSQQMSIYQPQQSYLQQQQAGLLQTGFQPGMTQAGMPGMGQGTDMMLLSETRQQNTEVRLSLSKVSDKLDNVIQKLDHGQSQGGTAMMPNMETSVLLHNVTRIVQENERLKKDVFDKSAKIETQNEKISELLQRNQSFVEKSQVLMEQRNEGMLSSANQTQTRVLTLEQDKVGLTKQLSEATSQISALQMEVSGLKKHEFELTQQLETTGKSSHKQTEELEMLRTQRADDESHISDLQRQLREERQGKKSVEGSMAQLQEEMSDLQAAKQALEKNVSERKRKAAEERRQLEDDMEDVKANLEAEIQSLKEKLRKQKTSASVSSQVQISQLEEEITADWKARSNKLVALAEEKHARALRAVNEEKEEMAEKIQELTNKIQSIRESHSGSDQHVSELEERVEQLAPWKDKYESLRANASTMKEHYEGRIEELEEGQTTLERQLEAARASQGDSAAAAAGSPQGLLDEVKKIMNNVYKELREQFEAGESYTGTKVLQAILASIKSTTLALMKRQESQATEEESGSEEEEEEAEEEEDDDDDDDDDDDEEEDEEESEEENEETAEQKPEPTVIKTEISEDKPSTGVEDNKKVDDEDDVDKKAGENEGDVEKEDLDKECVDEEDKQDEVEEDAESYQDELDAEIEGQSRAGKADIDKGTGDGQETKRETSEQTNTAVNNVPKQEVTSAPGLKHAGSLDDLLDSALESKQRDREPEPMVGMEPPPLGESGDEQEEDIEKDRTKSIFGEDSDDDNMAASLGISTKAVVNGEPTSKSIEKQTSNDEDLKPQPPPPLFGDDDDDDDLDWLS